MKSGHPASDRRRVTSAIRKAEKNTSAEIVVVAARQSDDYIHVPLHIAAGLALAVPLVMPLLARFFPWASVSVIWIFWTQLVTFITAALILSIVPLRYAVTPKRLMHKYAHRHAAAQFLGLNMHGTGGRTGVLIFVSLLECYVEIVADIEVARKVGPGVWQEIIDEMLPLLRSHQTADALALAVKRCGEILAEHFPPGMPNLNELPDHFIVID